MRRGTHARAVLFDQVVNRLGAAVVQHRPVLTDVKKRRRLEHRVRFRRKPGKRRQRFELHGRVIREIPRRLVANTALRLGILENDFAALLLRRQWRRARGRFDETFTQKHAERIDVILGGFIRRTLAGMQLRARHDAFLQRFAFRSPAIRSHGEQAPDEHRGSSRNPAHFFGRPEDLVATQESLAIFRVDLAPDMPVVSALGVATRATHAFGQHGAVKESPTQVEPLRVGIEFRKGQDVQVLFAVIEFRLQGDRDERGRRPAKHERSLFFPIQHDPLRRRAGMIVARIRMRWTFVTFAAPTVPPESRKRWPRLTQSTHIVAQFVQCGNGVRGIHRQGVEFDQSIAAFAHDNDGTKRPTITNISRLDEGRPRFRGLVVVFIRAVPAIEVRG